MTRPMERGGVGTILAERLSSEPAGTTTVAGNAGFTRPGADAVHSLPGPRTQGVWDHHGKQVFRFRGRYPSPKRRRDGGANEGSKTTSSPPGR